MFQVTASHRDGVVETRLFNTMHEAEQFWLNVTLDEGAVAHIEPPPCPACGNLYDHRYPCVS